ncbi:MAG: PKD domain-containing protein [Deltaproteobacteria bacterium]|nr:PKD domain-containing protein [Deltaproteobacteria bacterium]
MVVASEFPAASFDAQPKNGLPPLDVSFLNFSTGTIDETRWDFGDGETSAETEPAHRYTAAGTYTVSLTVSGPAGSDNAVMDGMIVVGCPAPEADFNYGPDEGPAPLTVDFANATDSVEGCGTAALWDFGDGGEGSGNEIRHTYAEPGVYSVGLLVSTPGGSDHAFKNNIIKVGVDGSSDDLDDDADDDDDDDGGGGACGCSS